MNLQDVEKELAQLATNASFSDNLLEDPMPPSPALRQESIDLLNQMSLEEIEAELAGLKQPKQRQNS